VDVVLRVLGDKLVDIKELWDVLDANFSATDPGGELYIMELFNDYIMVEN
jgi:hypothetical protein